MSEIPALEDVQRGIADANQAIERLTRALYEQGEALRRAERDAEQAGRAKSRFLANISHELRTPLNSIIGFANILLKDREGHLSEKEIDFLGRIRGNGMHLLKLVNTLLDLSKLEAGWMVLEVSPVSIVDLVAETVAQMQAVADEKGLALKCEGPTDFARVETDAGRLKQVLINLMGNALKFTTSGGITVRIVPDGDARRPRAIEVVDTGPGIPKDRLRQVLGTCPNAEHEATVGLGLGICTALMAQLGGGIEAESHVGEGSLFRVILPRGVPTGAKVAHPSQGGDRAITSETQETQCPRRFSGHSVLVVDDDNDSRILLAHYLEDLGFRVFAAASAEQGMRMAKTHLPDLIMIDPLMSRMEGWFALQGIRSEEGLRDSRVVVVGSVPGNLRSEVEGSVDFLSKPVIPAELLSVLKRSVKPRVLAVDDDEAILGMIARVLANEGTEFRTCRDGAEAIRILQGFSPDLILLDLMLPEMDGFAIVDTLRRNSALRDVPVVVMTGMTLEPEQRGRLAVSASAIINKGTSFWGDLRQAVGRHLGRLEAPSSTS